MLDHDTIVAPATPTGESALAVIRVSGARAIELATACHRGTTPPPRKIWHGDYFATGGSIIDDAIFSFFPGPKSYTGEDSFEISCHGNPFIVSKIIEDITSRGFRLADPGEFTKRAFLHGRLDLTEAEAVMDLIRARSDQALAIAQRQLRGALRQRMDGIVHRLLDLCAAAEAHVDFPEDDLPAADRDAWREVATGVAVELRGLAATRRDGDRLREGVKVVLIGEPNAGKSSLLNRLVGFERALVSEDPGTTRDFIEERLSLGGFGIRLFDTAGMRDTAAPVERAGVERTLAWMHDADVLVLVVDAGKPAPSLPAEVVAALAGPSVLIAANKSDRPERTYQLPSELNVPVIEVSALTGEGVECFRASLRDLIANGFLGAGLEDRIVVNARHEKNLVEAADCLERASLLLQSNPATELVAIDVRSAIAALGLVLGTVDPELILDRIFATFCIGK